MSSKSFIHSLAVTACALLVASGTSAPSTREAPLWRFNDTVAWDYLVNQVSFGPRVPGTDPQIKCRDYLLAELKKSCDDAHLQHLF